MRSQWLAATLQRSSRISHKLGEDELVTIGLKYLHREVGLGHHAGSTHTASSEENS
jgi:hypothetical protein